jgi:hypothetical protein
MLYPLDHPLLILVGSLLSFWISARIGSSLSAIYRSQQNDDSGIDFVFVVGAALTLLGLVIGFTFSMAVSRYDQRKNLEEQEANAIGTEYVRADLLPTADAAKVRVLLKGYLDQRILYYKARKQQELREINARVARLEAEMWPAVAIPAAADPTSVKALSVAGMNDVMNSEGYTQAAWWNRLPIGAWTFLITLSIFCNLLIGYAAHRRSTFLLLILPIVLSISLFLIADIDSPRGGVIRVHPQNLERLAESLQ